MPGSAGSQEHSHRKVPIPQLAAQEQCAPVLPSGDRPPQGMLSTETSDWTGENMKKRKLTIIIPAGNDSPDLYPSGGRGLPTVVRDLPTG